MINPPIRVFICVQRWCGVHNEECVFTRVCVCVMCVWMSECAGFYECIVMLALLPTPLCVKVNDREEARGTMVKNWMFVMQRRKIHVRPVPGARFGC